MTKWELFEAVATKLLEGSPLGIAIAVLITFGVPILLHIVFYRTVASPPSSNFLLLGPSGAGKTALLTLLESKSSFAAKPKSQATHTSQTSTLSTVRLPVSVPIASNKYRSVNDPTLKEGHRNPIKYRVKDTPGHGKLRGAHGLSELQSMSNSKETGTKLRGILFMVDTAALSETETLRDAASYLYDVLLILQKRALGRGKSSAKAAAEIPVLIAANKQDLFTALPPGSVREKLEAEIDRIRKSKSKGLMDASADAGEGEGEDDILGSYDLKDTFNFKAFEAEIGVDVEVVGGAIKGDEGDEVGAGVRRWEEWIGQCL
ncbi:signal recognition particle receptor beta subunit-domain-containing protein [Aspergillus karnatakaensis]|uniref:signal recognition particle receptor subunit beta n=1 Tax=Aspergillus karnatakaensis TaxID=1810916 RepID=UPI003CCD82A2